VVQVLGAGAMGIAALPCAIAALVLGAPLWGAGWWAWSALEGWQTTGGLTAGTVTAVLAAALFYCVACAVLVPVSALPFAYAARVWPVSAASGRSSAVP
jgi:hypothetical protein